jgi:hypothetical protein
MISMREGSVAGDLARTDRNADRLVIGSRSGGLAGQRSPPEPTDVSPVSWAFARHFLAVFEDSASFETAVREWVARMMVLGEEGGMSASIDFGTATIRSLVRLSAAALDQLAEETERPIAEVRAEFLARTAGSSPCSTLTLPLQ